MVQDININTLVHPGDAAMNTAVTSNFSHEIRAYWVGSYRIISAQNDWIYEIQDLPTRMMK